MESSGDSGTNESRHGASKPIPWGSGCSPPGPWESRRGLGGLVCSPMRHPHECPAWQGLPSSVSDAPEGLHRSRPGEEVVFRARTVHHAEPGQGGPWASKETWQVAWCPPLGCTLSSVLHGSSRSQGQLPWTFLVLRRKGNIVTLTLTITEHLPHVRLLS